MSDLMPESAHPPRTPVGKKTPSAQGLKDKCLLLLNKCQAIARMSSPPFLPLRLGSPGSSRCRSHHLLPRTHHPSLGSRRCCSGRGSAEGRGGQALRSPTWEGDGLRTKHLVRGKRMFCNFWPEFPEAEQEMSTGAGSSREKWAAVSLQRGTSVGALSGI